MAAEVQGEARGPRQDVTLAHGAEQGPDDQGTAQGLGYARSPGEERDGRWQRKLLAQDVCASFCEDCPICLVQKEKKKPRAGWQPLITHGMNVRGQVDLIDPQVRFSNTKQLSSGSGATLSLAPSHCSTVFEY
eukprot:COSAG02_NODE_18268_length_949_cov_1.642353_2_plen_133_part_00